MSAANSRLDGRNVTIVGAGIAGLATAIAMVERGARVTVLEQAPAITEIGAGIQVSPNGLAVLDGLGLGQAARDRGQPIAAICLHDGLTGRLVTRLALDRTARPYLAFHRADLIDMLAAEARARDTTVLLSSMVADPAAFAGADLLIGADGLHSIVRTALNGDDAPAFTGQIAWRALVAGQSDPAGEVRVFMGPGRHLVTYPLRGGALVNIVAVEETATWTRESWSAVGDADTLRAAFAGYGAEVQALLDRVEKVHLWGLFRHPIAVRWHDGRRAALVGDAAHPTLPFLAQGANMALEDAWVLSAHLDRHAPPNALAAYQAIRRPRVARAIRVANANARNYHLRRTLTRAAGHAVLSALGNTAPQALASRFDWLYRHDVTSRIY